jgi:CHAT domain-containing protein
MTILPEKSIETLGDLGLNKLVAALSAGQIRTVMIVPYGRLGLFPLPSVRIQLPERANCSFNDLFAVSVVPSARAAEIAWERSQIKQQPNLLLGGNPQPLAAGKSLPFSTAEVDTIYRLARCYGFPTKYLHLLTPHDMQKSNIVAGLKTATYAHLALHGHYQVADPRKSVLLLAGDSGVPLDGRTINLGEVLDGNIPLTNLRLLVLSACETSLFDISRVPNEVVGLAAGFMQTGVAGVIASLWPVVDEATYLLMTRFASFYLDPQGLWTPAQALALAQKWLRTEATHAVLQDYDPLPPGSLVAAGPGSSPVPYDHDAALAVIRKKANRLAIRKPDELPYADPVYWSGFVLTGR